MISRDSRRARHQTAMNFNDALNHVAAGAALSEFESQATFESLLAGSISTTDIASFLTAIASRGPTVNELVGAARVLRRRSTPVPRPTAGPFANGFIMDTCGTGGARKLFNISTLSAIIIPSASDGGIMVAKHGNVSRTGRGSAEVLAALGVNTRASPDLQTRCLGEIGVCFCLAPAHHPAARHVAAARKSLPFPTVFNLLGPLANPAGAERQCIGTWSHANARLMAEALHRLGAGPSWVHSSNDGLDEFTLSDTNIVHQVRDKVTTHDYDPRAFGFLTTPIEDMQANSLDEATSIFRRVLAGEPGPFRDITLWSVGAALAACAFTTTVQEGIVLAREALDSGAAMRTFTRLADISNS